MNAPDPSRTPEEQMQHDIRGLRMQVEALAQMVADTVALGRARRQRWTNRFFAVMIAILFLLVCCQPAKPTWRLILGYSNGTEAFNGECKNFTTLSECINCCKLRVSGLGQTEVNACIDLCLSHHGEAAAQEELAQAHAYLATNDRTDVVRWSRQMNLLKACAATTAEEHQRTARIARGLLRQLGMMEPVQS